MTAGCEHACAPGPVDTALGARIVHLGQQQPVRDPLRLNEVLALGSGRLRLPGLVLWVRTSLGRAGGDAELWCQV